MAAAGAAAAAAAVIRAIQASGVIVRVPPESFADILARTRDLLVVHAQGGFFAQKHQYLTSYKGLAFTTRTSQPLNLPADAEVVEANRIWTPG
jgi:hypothetical protein